MFTASPFAPASRQAAAGGLYHQISVETQVSGEVDPHRLVAMLFDGLLDAIAQARGAMRAKDIAVKGKALARASAIVGEGLRGSLDLERGGALARELDTLYGYLTKRLALAHLKNDEQLLDECVRLITPLREAWAGIRPAVQAGTAVT
jgi:flagellar protein FliS